MLKAKVTKSLVLGLVFSTLLSATVFAGSSEAVKGTPTIDGTMDDAWKSAKVIDVNVIQANIKLEKPATAQVRTMWDAKNLYVFAEVTDSKLNKNPSQQPWEVDSVEFFIDENNSKGGSYDGDDAQYRVDIDNKLTGGAGAQMDLFTQSAVVKTETGYIIEAAIPLRAEAKEGAVMGFEVMVNDDAGNGMREGMVGWTQTAGDAFANPGVFGTITLVAAPAAPAEDTAAPAEDTAAPAENPKTGDVSALAYLAMAGVSGAALLRRKVK